MAADAANTTAPLPSVSLDFGGRSGAWDDRELVNAYDAALLEFHIHNPGPGSWLDKATAALAKGQPLPGANAFGTEWYTAAKRIVDGESSKAAAAAAAVAEATKSEAGPSKKKRRTATAATTTTAATAARAYSPSAAVDSPMSPRFEPPSPGAGAGADAGDEGEWEDVEGDANGGGDGEGEGEEGYEDGYDYGEGEGEEDGDGGTAEEGYDGMPEWDGMVGNDPASTNPYDAGYAPAAPMHMQETIFPPPLGQWPMAQPAVSRDAALGFALNAQYWAGYWMGVARGAGRGQPGAGSGSGGKKRGGGGGGAGRAVGSGSAGAASQGPAWAGNGAAAGARKKRAIATLRR